MGKNLTTSLRIAVLAFTLLWTQLNAQDEFTFAGIGIGAYNVELDDTNLSGGDVSTMSLRLGKQTRHARAFAELDITDDYTSAGLFFDYIPFDTVLGSPLVRPYVGVNIQYLFYDKNYISQDGLGLGGQAGLLIYASDTLDVDISYRYLFIQHTELLDTADGFNLSIHYFFE